MELSFEQDAGATTHSPKGTDPRADPFNIRAQVPDYETFVSEYQDASAAARRHFESRLNVSYGAHPDETLDLFFPARGLGEYRKDSRAIHMFVHGGYWHRFSKELYSFVAESIVAAGAIAAIIDFSRLPLARLEVLVDQVRRAAFWLREQAAGLGANPLRLSASGHSAGAHLASYLVCRAPGESQATRIPVRSVLLISGLFDLAPVAQSFLQPTLELTAGEIAKWSPCQAIPHPEIAVQIAVGQRETQPYLQAAAGFSARFQQAGTQCRTSTIADENHMSIVRSLGDPQSRCADLLRASIAAATY